MTYDLASIQPFSLSSNGGGPRVLRALMQTEHPPILFIDTGIARSAPKSTDPGNIAVPYRGPFPQPLRRLEGSPRSSPIVTAFEPLFGRSFKGRLETALRSHNVRAAHLIPHGYDFVATWSVCRKLGVPVVLNVHDDLAYSLKNHSHRARALDALGRAWRESEAIISISHELAAEYNRRYGERSYFLVTDGVTHVTTRQKPEVEGKLTVYFMGMFHYVYLQSFYALLEALDKIQQTYPERQIELICRCGPAPLDTSKAKISVTMLPFGSEADVERDMEAATILYQPLSFDADAAALGRFSLSTKMITYLGSGLPILYHGPADAAACNLLRRHNAAATCTTLSVLDLTAALDKALTERAVLIANAKTLVESNFLLKDQQQRFWQAIRDIMSYNSTTKY